LARGLSHRLVLNSRRGVWGGRHIPPSLLALGLTAAAPLPRLVPTHDVTITYTLTPESRPPITITAAIAAGGRLLHVTSEDLPTTILVNRDTERAAILLPILRAYADVKIGRYDPEHTILRGAAFTRAGARTIAGHRCTDWRATSPDGQATACITPDGVILRGEAGSGRHGPLGAIIARRVTYGPLDPALFQIPANFQKSPIPIDPEGFGPNGPDQ
jgi:hypothetical protein